MVCIHCQFTLIVEILIANCLSARLLIAKSTVAKIQIAKSNDCQNTDCRNTVYPPGPSEVQFIEEMLRFYGNTGLHF